MGGSNFDETVMEGKRDYIGLRWGVNSDFLDSLLDSRDLHKYLFSSSKNSRKDFKRRLKRLSRSFEDLAWSFPIEDRFFIEDPKTEEYFDNIRSNLPEHKFIGFMNGNWNHPLLNLHENTVERVWPSGIPDKLRTSNYDLSRNPPISPKDSFLEDYQSAIRKSLNHYQFKQYLNGEWDDRICEVVSKAQKGYCLPRRQSSNMEVNKRASFQPRPEYGSYHSR